MTDYNQRRRQSAGFFPFTFLDTSFCRSRTESDDGDDNICNLLEARKVRWVILRLISHVSKHGGSSALTSSGLKSRIAGIAPYRHQVQMIREIVSKELMGSLDIAIDTVDSMQGGQRDIVIFSCTRSNDKGTCGFLSNRKRLNVAFSRAKNLLVVIGDSEHLFRNTCFRFFISWCRDSRDGAGMMTARPIKGDEIATQVTRGGSMHLFRRRSGYDLRPKKRPGWLKDDAGGGR